MTGTLTRIWSWVKQTIQGGWHTDQNTGPEAKNNYSSTIKSGWHTDPNPVLRSQKRKQVVNNGKRQ